MQIRAIQSIKKFLRRISAPPVYVLHKTRLTVLYAAVALTVLAAWAVVIVASPAPAAPSHKSSQSEPQTILEAEPENTGGTDQMEVTTPDANNSANSSSSLNSQTSVTTDDSGTTVTVNGNSQTTPPGQSFRKSYESSSGDSTTHVDVSVDNGTATDGGGGGEHSVNLHMHSSTRSSTDSNTQTNP
jgi:hypothetical protein